MIDVLLFAVAQAMPAAPPLAQPYEALGHEPNWTLRIEGGQARFTAAGSNSVSVALPAAQTGTLQGLQGPMAVSGYETPGLGLVIMHTLCIDSVGGRQYSDAVTVTLDDTEFQGCGGAIVPFDALHETNWLIVEIVGQAVQPADERPRIGMGFSFGGFSGFAGCSHFNGRYTLRGSEFAPSLRRPSTGIDCDEAARNRQQRLLAILGGAMRMSLDGDTLELTGAAGRIRLTRDRQPE